MIPKMTNKLNYIWHPSFIGLHFLELSEKLVLISAKNNKCLKFEVFKVPKIKRCAPKHC